MPQGSQAGAGSQTPALPDPGKTFNQGRPWKDDQKWSHSQHPYLLGPLGRSPEERKFHSLDFFGCWMSRNKAIVKQRKKGIVKNPTCLQLAHFWCITTCKMNPNECLGKIMPSRQLYSSGWLTMSTADPSRHALLQRSWAKSYLGFLFLCVYMCMYNILCLHLHPSFLLRWWPFPPTYPVKIWCVLRKPNENRRLKAHQASLERTQALLTA